MLSKVKYKKTYVVFYVLEFILIAMILGWNYYKERKMGMVRHIMHRNVYKFPKILTENNIYILLGVLVLFLVVQLILVIKSKRFVVSLGINLLCTALSIYYILNNSVDTEFIYYYIIIFCVLFNTLRFIQFLLLDFKRKSLD